MIGLSFTPQSYKHSVQTKGIVAQTLDAALIMERLRERGAAMQAHGDNSEDG